eukprot:7713815-Lingulodinium_polyedra.AAC.1
MSQAGAPSCSRSPSRRRIRAAPAGAPPAPPPPASGRRRPRNLRGHAHVRGEEPLPLAASAGCTRACRTRTWGRGAAGVPRVAP